MTHFTTATIQDWLEQIKAIAGETEERYISSGNLGESEIKSCKLKRSK